CAPMTFGTVSRRWRHARSATRPSSPCTSIMETNAPRSGIREAPSRTTCELPATRWRPPSRRPIPSRPSCRSRPRPGCGREAGMGPMAKPITFVKRSKDTNAPAGPQVHRYPELAQLFATAFVSYLMDVRFQTALKRYGQTPANTYWLDLADRVCADY